MANCFSPFHKRKITFLLVCISVLFSFPIFAASSQSKAKTARIQADLAQIRAIATLAYGDEGSYGTLCTSDHKININHLFYSTELSTIDKDVRLQGSIPECYASKNNFCIFAKLLDKEDRYKDYPYFCIDSSGAALRTYHFPGDKGFCDGNNFSCPPEEKGKISIMYIAGWVFWAGGALCLVILSFIHNAKRNKERALPEESWQEVRNEVKEKSWFYILNGLLILNILFSALFYLVGYGLPDWLTMIMVPILFFIGIFPFFLPLSILVGFLLDFKRIKQKKNRLLCWEGYAVSFAWALLWLLINLSLVETYPSVAQYFSSSFISGLFILLAGLSLSLMSHKGRLNKIFGLVPIIFCILVLLFIILIV